MREFQERKRFKNILYSKGTVIVLILLIAFFARATYGVYQKQKESRANVVQAQNELKKLQDRQILLDSELARLSTEEGIEEEIRSKYGVTKPGEQMIIIVDQSSTTPQPMHIRENWWEKFKNLFKQ